MSSIQNIDNNRYVQFCDPGLHPVTGFGRYFAAPIYVVGAALLMLIRPVILQQPAPAKEQERARRVVEAHGRSSMARLTLCRQVFRKYNIFIAADLTAILTGYVP
jgi:ribosomal protein S14